MGFKLKGSFLYIAIAFILIFLTIYSYRQFKLNEAREHQEALMRIYQSYGESLLNDFKKRELLALQSRFRDSKGIDLEEIALFIDTLHLDRASKTKWRHLKIDSSNIEVRGDLNLDNNVDYPIDIFLVKRDNKILLKSIKIDKYELKVTKKSFPLKCNCLVPTQDKNNSMDKNGN